MGTGFSAIFDRKLYMLMGEIQNLQTNLSPNYFP